ncbi:MAG: hypothetical protein R2715_24570 [Ilumatobacteraceae bacterium]
MKFVDDFESFLRSEVNLNQTRLDRLQNSVNAIENFLAGQATFAPLFLDMIPAGSWAHRTIIKPVGDFDEFDGDVLLYVKENTDWQPKDYIEQLYAAFRGSDTYKSKAQRKTRCVRIDYAGDFHVDVVPYLERFGSHYITNRLEPEDEGRFEASDPEAFSAWIDERQRASNGSFVKAVRLLKYLRDYKNTFSCKSIILTTLLGNELNPVIAELQTNSYKDVPTTLNTLLQALAKSLPETMPAVMDPAGTGDNFTDRYKDDWNYPNFRKRIISYADKVKQAFDETDREKSIKLWQDIFGTSFKPGALTKSASPSPFSAGAPWSGESFIDQAPYGFPIRLDPAARLHVTGRCTGLRIDNVTRRNGFRTFELARSGNRVPKNRSLQFTARLREPGRPLPGLLEGTQRRPRSRRPEGAPRRDLRKHQRLHAPDRVDLLQGHALRRVLHRPERSRRCPEPPDRHRHVDH